MKKINQKKFFSAKNIFLWMVSYFRRLDFRKFFFLTPITKMDIKNHVK
jgi:hypothetical protein